MAWRHMSILICAFTFKKQQLFDELLGFEILHSSLRRIAEIHRIKAFS